MDLLQQSLVRVYIEKFLDDIIAFGVIANIVDVATIIASILRFKI